MKKPPKYLTNIASALLVWGAFSVPYVFAAAPDCTGVSSAQAATLDSYSVAISSSTSATTWTTDYFSITSGAHMYYDICYFGQDITQNGVAFNGSRTDAGVSNATFGSSLSGAALSSASNGPPWFPSSLDVEPAGMWALVLYSDLNTSPGTRTGIIQFNWVPNVGGAGVVPFVLASTTSGTILAQAQTFCAQANATSSGFLSDIGNGFSYGLCVAGAFLFVPSADSLTNFATLASTTKGKIPFSYVYELQTTFSTLVGSSTANLSAITINFPDISSTTAFGSFIPSTIVGLSTTTIGTYLPDAVRLSFLSLQRIALWLGLAYMFYRRIIPYHAVESKHV